MDRPEARLAVRLSFLVAGCGIGCMAVLVPGLARLLPVDAGSLVIGLLALLAGACAGARGTGTGRAGPMGRGLGLRFAVLTGGWGSALALPACALVDGPMLLAAALCVFGIFAGLLDAAMHVNAEAVARSLRRPRRWRGLVTYGIGAAGGALVTMLLLVAGFEPPLAAALVAAPMMIATTVAGPYLLESDV